jgi:hypothetical protein
MRFADFHHRGLPTGASASRGGRVRPEQSQRVPVAGRSHSAPAAPPTVSQAGTGRRRLKQRRSTVRRRVSRRTWLAGLGRSPFPSCGPPRGNESGGWLGGTEAHEDGGLSVLASISRPTTVASEFLTAQSRPGLAWGSRWMHPPRSRKLDCLQLPVGDLDADVAFYERLGHEVIWRRSSGLSPRAVGSWSIRFPSRSGCSLW